MFLSLAVAFCEVFLFGPLHLQCLTRWSTLGIAFDKSVSTLLFFCSPWFQAQKVNYLCNIEVKCNTFACAVLVSYTFLLGFELWSWWRKMWENDSVSCCLFRSFEQVGLSNTDCLKFGGAFCKLNYEDTSSYNITVRVTDSGAPPLSQTFSLTINLNDMNDQPRNLALSNFKVSKLSFVSQID